MPAPVINSTTSILEYRQWQQFEYQPFATNVPDSWACPNLPTGLSVDTDTGKISGAASVSGIFVCALTATNGDGTSAPLVLTIGITESTEIVTNSGLEVEIDVVTREVKLSGGSKIFVRQNDDLLLWLRFKKGGSVLDLDITSLEISLKEYEPDARLVLGNDFEKFGSGVGTYYGLHVAMTGSEIKAALQNYEADQSTEFEPVCEIGWQETNAESGSFGPAVFRFSTQPFGVLLARDTGTTE